MYALSDHYPVCFVHRFSGLKVAYYSFRMKTIAFFKLEYFQQLKVSTGLIITEIDVNYHFTF